ncbi:putative negative regulator sulfur controller-3 [Zopfochytrium polystomum]|nr:putative negative regulator sulfur controller-3 [Zopfochytrium polystomum]
MTGSVKLASSDGEEFVVERQIAERSILLKNMLEDVGETDTDSTAIPLPNVNAKTLTKVVEYCTHHKDDPPAAVEKEPYDPARTKPIEMSDWDAKFIDLENDDLFEVILAANYLDIKALLELGCMAVAQRIKGKSVDEMRKIFNLEGVYSEEEEAQIKKELAWADDA